MSKKKSFAPNHHLYFYLLISNSWDLGLFLTGFAISVFYIDSGKLISSESMDSGTASAVLFLAYPKQEDSCVVENWEHWPYTFLLEDASVFVGP